MIFMRITEFMRRMSRDFIDADCKAQCFAEDNYAIPANADSEAVNIGDHILTDSYFEENSGSDFCTTTRDQYLACKDPNVKAMPSCVDQCRAGFTRCKLEQEVRQPCQALILEEDRWFRKMQALEAAIDIYLDRGYLTNDKQVTVKSGPAYCTTSYGNRAAMNRQVPLVWSDVALHTIDIQFDMNKMTIGDKTEQVPFDPFNDAEEELNNENLSQVRITQFERLYVEFSSKHKMWYTKQAPNGLILPSMASEPLAAGEFGSATTVIDGKTYQRDIPTQQVVKTKHGLQVSLDMTTRQVKFTDENYVAMEGSNERQTKRFFTYHKKALDLMRASEPVLGTFRSLKPDRLKTPFPCKIAWGVTQMLETTPYTQNCVRMVVQASAEFFFVLTDSISDQGFKIFISNKAVVRSF